MKNVSGKIVKVNTFLDVRREKPTINRLFLPQETMVLLPCGNLKKKFNYNLTYG